MAATPRSVCDALAEQLGAERAHVLGARHTTPHAGQAFNDRLETFMHAAERSSHAPNGV